ncbi:MAG: tetratricopeptide repeat protein [Fibrobacteria bacterium]
MKTLKISWIINPFMDFSFFLAAPLLILPAFHFLSGYLSMNLLKLGVLSVSATGHHLPGFIRAYTDRKVFLNFKPRLILVPSLIILFAIAAAYFKLSLIFYVLVAWSAWHGSMQVFGFLRIYDAKAKFISASTARLDFWMCLTWFVQVILWSPAKLASVLSIFYLSGGPLIPVAWAQAFEKGWWVLTAAVTVAYGGQLAYNRFRRGYLNLPKLLCMASGIGFWAYCLIGVDQLILGLILWEVFHDLQYNVFVWNYNHSRVRRGLSESGIERFLFQADWKRLGLYALCIAAYGSVGLLTQDVLNTYENMETYRNLLYQAGNVFTASALIHFYLDGFIWKIRDGKVRADLGLQPDAPTGLGPGLQAADSYGARRDARHWVLVAFFSVAIGCLGASEYFHWNGTREGSMSANLADLVPASGYANFMKASSLRSAGKADSAVIYYERSIRNDTNYKFAHLLIARLKADSDDADGAILHFEKAKAALPGDETVRADLAGLYLRTRQYEKAEAEYRFLAAQAPDNPAYQYGLGWTFLQMKKGLQAKPFLERTLELDPDQPKAWNYLGMVEQANGNADLARRYYLKSLALDSAYGHPRENLSALESP